MIEAGEAIAEFLAGRSRTELDSNRMLLFAIVRAIEVIGEAASKVSDETRSGASSVPWKAIVGMRNRIIHAYWDIDTEIVWKTSTQEIPTLLPILEAVVGRKDGDRG